MGLFSRKKPSDHLRGMKRQREVRLNVVGESNYQPAILAACGAKRGEGVSYECMAVLVPEPENPYDSNAVRVDVGERVVGYLSRDDAKTYGPVIGKLIGEGKPCLVTAVIAGRGSDGETDNLGVFLNMNVSY